MSTCKACMAAIFVSEFGKTVFLTREEAEKALEARKDETS